MTGQTIAFFDFDGTLTRHDTFLAFARFAKGEAATLRCVVRSLGDIAAWKLGRIGNGEAKERLFGRLFGGMSHERIALLAEQFAERIIADMRHDVFRQLLRHRQEGHTVCVVSASVDLWIAPWIAASGSEVDRLICTKAEIDSRHRLTGRFDGGNCHGGVKAERILADYPQLKEQFAVIYVYTDDARSDAPMLALANHPVII